jgi:hypothetical protein
MRLITNNTTMKKLISILTVCLLVFSASAQYTATASTNDVISGKSTGLFSFVLSNEISSDQVDGVKGYYESYFTVNFNPATHVMQVKMKAKEELNYKVMNRLMISLNVQTYLIDGNKLTFDDFFNKYLMK